MSLRVAFVGTGEKPDDPGRDGFAMAYRHAAAYERIEECELVACADIVPENAAAFADHFGVEGVYEEYERMLAETDPDVVSVCVPPVAHAEVVGGCARVGDLAAIHCEKPMALTWAECNEMVEICEAEGVELTINHQRRFGKPFRRAKALLDRGEIGDLERVAFATKNLYDSGTHLFDLVGYYTDQSPPAWVLAGLDYTEENRWFGAHNENQAVVQWRHENGVYGFAATGRGAGHVGADLRLVGSQGVIELGADDGPALRVSDGVGSGWRVVDVGENLWGDPQPGYAGAAIRRLSDALGPVPDPYADHPSNIDRAIADVVRAVREGGESELTARNALQTTELIFGCWESARRRGRVAFPIEIDDNPLEAMVEDGLLGVEA